ncbi:hypothetical protein [Sphingobacterium cavernae]|uniref:hypothetical protein n=1 Tax=Sphingobacterium cavernae TaxID=2592657 RepID=UPI00122FB855|nr:hypothetical protein [Sphingobacterium cavernae]
MNLKKSAKWVLISLIIFCAYLLGKYQAEILIYMTIGLFPLGIYLIYNPTLITQSSFEELNDYNLSLYQDLKGYHENLEVKAEQLLEQYRFSFHGKSIVSCFYILIMLMILVGSIHHKYKLILLFVFSIMLIVYVLLESDSYPNSPFSRRERVKTKYYLSVLNNRVALKELIKVNDARFKKNDFSNYIIDNKSFDKFIKLLVVNNLLIKTPTSKYSFNLIEGTESQNLSSLLAVLTHNGIIKADITRGQNKKNLDTFFEFETTAAKNSKDYLCYLEPRDFNEYLQVVKDPSKKSHAGLNQFIIPYQNLLDSINKS